MIKKISRNDLFVSEPNPAMFGNPRNPASHPAWTNENWLKSRFHFNFAEYYDPSNNGFGVLRVMNDDLVQPDRGFGAHPHRNMEIVTYIVEGDLTHQDSNKNKETLGRGSVQFMTAGTGVVHSEHNLNKEKPLRFIQMWINPVKYNLPVNYGSLEGDYDARHNQWQHLVSSVSSGAKSAIQINQDANIFVSELDADKSLELLIGPDRQAYVLCMEGELTLSSYTSGEDSEDLQAHDAAKVYGSMKMQVLANTDAHLLVVEMAKK